MQPREVVSCMLFAAAAIVCVASVARVVEARTELHEIVAADMTEPQQWVRVTDFGAGENSAVSGADEQPLTEEQRFRQELYYELHPERKIEREEAKIRFVEQQQAAEEEAHAHEQEAADAEDAIDAEEAEASETVTEDGAEHDSEADAEAEGESEADSESEEAEAERVASMSPLSDADAGEAQADARYEMDGVLHTAPQNLMGSAALSLPAHRFAEVRAMVEANTADHAAEQAAALASQRQQTLMWSDAQLAAFDAFLDADAGEDEDEGEDEEADATEAVLEREAHSDMDAVHAQRMLQLNAEDAMTAQHSHRHWDEGVLRHGAAARMGMPDHPTEMDAADREMAANPREYDADASDTSDLEEAQRQVDSAWSAADAGRGHASSSGAENMRFARAPLPEDPDSRLYYARSRRGEKIRRMIRRGDMLYRYAPELMSKVFDPARKVDKPGVTPTFAMAMDGPLGPVTPPPPGELAAKAVKKGSQGPGAGLPGSFMEMEAHARGQMRDDDGGEEGGAAGGGGDDKAGAKGGDKPAKGSKEWIAKKLSEIDTLIKNPYDQAVKYPQMYQHWDNYMFPMRQRPLPPRWYPYPKKGRNPIAAFPPAASLFENPPQRGPLQTPNGLFNNPRGVGGLQPIPAAFAPIGTPSAPSPYASPLGFQINRFAGAGQPSSTDAANNGLLGPKNHPVYSDHPLPLQKWYQKFLQPAEPPKMTAPPGGAKADAEGGGEGGGSEE